MIASPDRRASAPLHGRRIMLTRPSAQAAGFAERIEALGGLPIISPAIDIAPPDSWAPVDEALAQLPTFEWLALTSVNAASGLLSRAEVTGVDRANLARLRVAAVGPSTAAMISAALRPPDIVAVRHDAASLAAAIPVVGGMRVLFPRGDLAGDALPDGLRRRGASVTDVVVYRTVPGAGLDEIVSCLAGGKVDALLFASASAVRAVAAALREGKHDAPAWPAIVCIGTATAAAARTLHWPVAAVAGGATLDRMIDRVVELLAPDSRPFA